MGVIGVEDPARLHEKMGNPARKILNPHILEILSPDPAHFDKKNFFLKENSLKKKSFYLFIFYFLKKIVFFIFFLLVLLGHGPFKFVGHVFGQMCD